MLKPTYIDAIIASWLLLKLYFGTVENDVALLYTDNDYLVLLYTDHFYS